ncbi:LysR substrate-binding domain-containing protein [Siculibacillus lacustris]|nr:LysR substrate-binding domain-containing protein [Siculibacillus lacustris]
MVEDRRESRAKARGAASPMVVEVRGRLPPLTWLRAFEAVGRHASMRAAAIELGVGHGVVSRHVRNLEEWFGRSLVVAGPRGIVLTGDGERLRRSAGAAFDLIAATTEDLRPRPAGGVLRIWCVPGLAARWLAARLDDLQEALGRVEIVLRATTERPDFGSDADVEIRFAEAPEPPPGARAALVERSRIFPVASPGWLAEHGPIVDLAGLAEARLIHEDSREQWRRWFAATGHRPRGDLAGPRLWYASSALDAATAGQGIALATRLQAADDLRAGRLVEILATDVRLGDYWLIGPEARWDSAVLAPFRRWLIAEMAATVDAASCA